MGVHVTEVENRLNVTGVILDSPGERAGFRAADTILLVEGVPVDNLPDMYRALWGAGEAGVEIR